MDNCYDFHWIPVWSVNDEVAWVPGKCPKTGVAVGVVGSEVTSQRALPYEGTRVINGLFDAVGRLFAVKRNPAPDFKNIRLGQRSQKVAPSQALVDRQACFIA